MEKLKKKFQRKIKNENSPQKSSQCCLLDWNGKKRNKNAVGTADIHFDAEIYSWFDKPGCQWGRIPVCKKHKEELSK